MYPQECRFHNNTPPQVSAGHHDRKEYLS